MERCLLLSDEVDPLLFLGCDEVFHEIDDQLIQVSQHFDFVVPDKELWRREPFFNFELLCERLDDELLNKAFLDAQEELRDVGLHWKALFNKFVHFILKSRLFCLLLDTCTFLRSSLTFDNLHIAQIEVVLEPLSLENESLQLESIEAHSEPFISLLEVLREDLG